MLQYVAGCPNRGHVKQVNYLSSMQQQRADRQQRVKRVNKDRVSLESKSRRRNLAIRVSMGTWKESCLLQKMLTTPEDARFKRDGKIYINSPF